MGDEVKPNSTTEPATTTKIDEVDAVTEKLAKLKALNDAYDAEKLRAEKNRTEQLMGGKSVMTPPAPVKSKSEELNEFLKNTSIRLK